MLQARDLTYTFSGQEILRFPDIQLETGERLLVLGESGVGKTTLLHLLAGLRKAALGSVELNGTHMEGLSGRGLDRFRAQHIGLIFQEPPFLAALSMRENLRLVGSLQGKRIPEDHIEDRANTLGIADYLHRKPAALSSGQRQRMAILRALIHEPALILADEPTSALDDTHAQAAMQLILEQAEAQNSMLITVTHDQRIASHFEHQIRLS